MYPVNETIPDHSKVIDDDLNFKRNLREGFEPGVFVVGHAIQDFSGDFL